MPAAAPLITAVAATAATGYSIYSGEQAASAGRRGIRRQGQAQQQAQDAATRQARAAAQAEAKANQKPVDSLLMLGDEALRANGGIASTMLTDPDRLRSGRSLLGA